MEPDEALLPAFPATALVDKVVSEVLDRVLATLPPERRVAFLLVDVYGPLD